MIGHLSTPSIEVISGKSLHTSITKMPGLKLGRRHPKRKLMMTDAEHGADRAADRAVKKRWLRDRGEPLCLIRSASAPASQTLPSAWPCALLAFHKRSLRVFVRIGRRAPRWRSAPATCSSPSADCNRAGASRQVSWPSMAKRNVVLPHPPTSAPSPRRMQCYHCSSVLTGYRSSRAPGGSARCGVLEFCAGAESWQNRSLGVLRAASSSAPPEGAG